LKQRRGEPGEDNRLSFEDFPNTALVRTFTANQQVSDSAPTATALVTGYDRQVRGATSEGEADAKVVSSPQTREHGE
jgi:alkaline phosphatase